VVGVNDNEMAKPVLCRQLRRAEKAEIRHTFSARKPVSLERDLKNVVGESGL
jgi:hypothetical protein